MDGWFGFTGTIGGEEVFSFQFLVGGTPHFFLLRWVTLQLFATVDRRVDGRPHPALKGLNNSAQGNALGFGSACQSKP